MPRSQRVVLASGLMSAVIGIVGLLVYLFAPIHTAHLVSGGLTRPIGVNSIQLGLWQEGLGVLAVVCLILFAVIAVGTLRYSAKQSSPAAILLWTSTGLLWLLASTTGNIDPSNIATSLVWFLLPSIALALIASFTAALQIVRSPR